MRVIAQPQATNITLLDNEKSNTHSPMNLDQRLTLLDIQLQEILHAYCRPRKPYSYGIAKKEIAYIVTNTFFEADRPYSPVSNTNKCDKSRMNHIPVHQCI